MFNQKSTQQYQEGINDAAFNMSSDLMCKTTVDGSLVCVNPSMLEHLEYSENDVHLVSLYDWIHADDKELVRFSYKQLASQSKETYRCHFRLKHKSGTYIRVDWQFRLYADTVFLVGRDITNELRRESYLWKIMDITQAGFWEIDLDTEKLYWSDIVHKIHETDPATYKPNLADGINFYHPDSLPTLSHAVQQQMLTGEPYDLELKFITAKKNFRWVRAVSHSEMKDGRVVRCYGTFQDITRIVEKRAETEKLKNRIDLALKASKIGIWDFELATNTLVWDEQMYTLYDVDEAHFGGAYETWIQSLHPEDKAMSEQAFTDAISGKKEFTPRFRIVTPSGHIRYIAAMAAVTRDKEGNPIRMLGVNWDVTEQEQIKSELLKQKLLAEQSDVAKSKFIANMSHELRTPLNSVIGFSARLLKRYDAVDKRMTEALRSINSNGHHLLSLVNDILDLSKIDAGRLELKYTSVPVAFFFNGIFEEFRDQIEEKGLDYDINISVENDLIAQLDELRCKQVILNLLSNAIKFTESGFIRAAIENTNDFLVISVQDSGIGVSEENKPLLFKRFEQFDEENHFNVGHGTGLGLSISREMIKMHGGSIEFTSERNVGTCFTVRLPLNGGVCDLGQ